MLCLRNSAKILAERVQHIQVAKYHEGETAESAHKAFY